jgi:hypothetical protein
MAKSPVLYRPTNGGNEKVSKEHTFIEKKKNKIVKSGTVY